MTINNDVYINQLKAAMLICKLIDQVFEAFINPNITSKFWFTKSSDKLEVKKQITWTWEMYGFSAQINVQEIEKNKKNTYCMGCV
ncbi:SRPBCC domain-containing protein [Rickettsia amblyommatis]|uniref:Activator of Hsp90 ATPase homologue 1/2-like C-terminal domain-containing protein n=1 Tax=Rickettsia amblyommatis str. Ac/Pa TaxID=1359164 RepID=A0A0F3N4H1_RICAM|nr:SRPBCC domain-containing protein [Rickettsia amblyommatis]KJV61799.1 hypothetical protein APHACPA_0815 [Rickettsia amblyommatis str. Ac/Pa]